MEKSLFAWIEIGFFLIYAISLQTIYHIPVFMQTSLLRIRILLTLLVLRFPLYHLGKWTYRIFVLTKKHLQDQIDLAKDRIRLAPDPEQDTETENSELISWAQESLEPILESSAPIVEEPQQEQQTKEEIPTKAQEQEFLSEDEHWVGKQGVSWYSAEKLAQTVDDIKYAALSYKERGKKDEYEKKLVEWISLVGDHEEFLIMLADHFFEEGHYVKAATLLKKIINLNPVNHRAIRQLWQIYAHDKDKETAKLLLEKARDLKDDNPKYLISLIEIYYEENNLRECVSLVEKLSKLRPTNIDYLLTLGKLHEELNQPTKAHSYYMKVLEINPLHDEAKQAIKRLL